MVRNRLNWKKITSQLASSARRLCASLRALRQTAAADGYRRQLALRQSAVHQELERRGVPIISSVSEVLNAVFVSAPPERVAELAAIPGVLGVRPMRQM